MIKIYKNHSEINIKETDVFLHFTGNIFGIGCNAFCHEATQKIINLKQRDENKSFIVLFSSIEDALQYQLPQLSDPIVSIFLNKFVPGNLTILSECFDERFDHLKKDNKIALRIPGSKLLRDFIKNIGSPIVSTSINVSGNPFCTDINIIQENFSDWFDWGLYDPNEEAGPAIPSTLIDFVKIDDNKIEIKCVREGSIKFEELEKEWDLSRR